jgi:hypothetical protein
MPTLNPDFRGADEVIVPPGIQTGWTEGNVTEREAVLKERYGAERLQNDMPVAMSVGDPLQPNPVVVADFEKFQIEKGRGPKSKDWSLLDEYLLAMILVWLPQIIGSCVISNTFRGYVIRLMYQIAFLGMPHEYLGRNEFGAANYAPYCPYNYGMARRRANMRGGDGLYCDVMVESFLKDGVVPCHTPKLQEICKANGVAGPKDFPEPQNASFYRAMGNWAHLDTLKPYADFTVQEFPYVTTADELVKYSDNCMPAPICSMIAIRKVGTHKDGFAIHARNPNDAWAHNMCFHGYFFASDGQLFFRFSNESWGVTHIYNVTFEEVAGWFRNRNVTSAAMGTINGPRSVPKAA